MIEQHPRSPLPAELDNYRAHEANHQRGQATLQELADGIEQRLTEALAAFDMYVSSITSYVSDIEDHREKVVSLGALLDREADRLGLDERHPAPNVIAEALARLDAPQRRLWIAARRGRDGVAAELAAGVREESV